MSPIRGRGWLVATPTPGLTGVVGGTFGRGELNPPSPLLFRRGSFDGFFATAAGGVVVEITSNGLSGLILSISCLSSIFFNVASVLGC